MAILNGHGDVVGLLRRTETGQPEPTLNSKYGELLWWAVKGGHEAVVELLLQQGADPNTANPTHWLG